LDLNESVKQIVKMLQRILGETIAIDVDYAPGAPLIRGDAGMIDQILLNLAVNARDAMSAGGRLAIKTEILPPVSQSEGAPLLPAVRLSVSDTGCGIRPEHLPHIFEPFFTTKEPGKGTGLGLATVYGIVKQHEGSIEITTNLGQGTTFQINFPGISSQTTAAGRVPTATTAPIGSNELILLVEDELPVRSVVTRLLQRNGYQVLTAQSGPEALKVWAENRDSIRLLLTDMVMPDGMTGRELASEIRALVPQLPVIYSSGYSPDLAGRLIEVQPGTRFLQKPYSSVALAQAVRESLAEAATKSNPTAG
jgi:CheY-like chemotaxis protein